MNNFDLRNIHELIPFKDLFTTQDEYMSELSRIPRIELDTAPLYVLTPKMPVLFTTKLRYYKLCVEREINNHINSSIELLEADETEELIKFVLKKTRESVVTLINEANRQIAFYDSSKGVWSNITSSKPIVSDFSKPIIEYVVYLHYVIAELVRCWLELQDRYAYVIGDAGCYDVSLFYTSLVGRNPDEEFELKRSDKYSDEVKGFKKGRTDCCFLYDNDEYFAMAIQEFTNKLKQHQLIPDSIDYKDMESLFSGRSCRKTYTWLGDNHVLTHIIKGLTKEEKPIITTWPSNMSKWEIISLRFVDKEGKHLPNIRKESLRIKQETIINEAVSALASYL